jgi:tetratricopeptide (TPR) repeat protein
MSIVWMLTGTSLYEVLQFMMPLELGPDARGLAVALSYYMMMVNLLLGLFNMLPLPPLDGYQAVRSLYRWLRRSADGEREPVASPKPVADATTGEGDARSPAQIHFDIGLEYQMAGQLDEAIARYRQAIEHDADFALAYYNQGLAYLSKGRLSLATSAFRAARASGDDAGVRIQAELRLRELAGAEQDPTATTDPVPPPLGSGREAEPVAGPARSLDPDVARRVWLRLAAGGTAMLLLAVVAWLVVTALTLAAMG